MPFSSDDVFNFNFVRFRRLNSYSLIRKKLLTRYPTSILLHAPNIHVGGGWRLLQCLLVNCSDCFLWMQLDSRIKKNGFLTNGIALNWVTNSVWSRLIAEWRLYRRSAPDATVLCFHGLPPLLPVRGHVVVFVQNRILFESSSLTGYPFATKVRLIIERLWARMMSENCNRYIVQTPSMAVAVRRCLGPDVYVSVLPFAPSLDSYTSVNSAFIKKYDFVYVASGEAHKNHKNLLEAWRLLADAGLKPSLALTINPQIFPSLSAEIARYTLEHQLNIVNLKNLNAMEITELYQSSSALIFPSLTESLGLPLIEATRLGLPVLASELDYVRDVIHPVETFDPDSPVSIVRAVRRFLGNVESTVQIGSANDFLLEVLK